tara:strand:- start:1309 stop:2547 length:1239 start_codon:yes stop_codon:yes gene_type:complete
MPRNFSLKKSPLAPIHEPKLMPVKGLGLYTFSAGLYSKKRDDIAIFVFPKNSSVAEVFTNSSIRSFTLDWNEKILKNKKIHALFVNSGNANTFTGNHGKQSIRSIVNQIKKTYLINDNNIFVASTGVIGEKFPVGQVLKTITKPKMTKEWMDSARAIMTTDTFPKGMSVTSMIEGKKVTITGISKGSGMIEPNMATMLGFIFIDADLGSEILNKLLKENISYSFNSISVDGDESTNDTVILASTRAIKFKKPIKNVSDKRIIDFKKKLKKVFMKLSELIVRDGEGATKLIEINVLNARNEKDANTFAKSIANSPLVKTAIHGSDPNWGRIIMALGKTYININTKKLKIYFGKYLVTKNGTANSRVNDNIISKYLGKENIKITVDLGLGIKSSRILTCDLSKQYIDINASYKT